MKKTTLLLFALSFYYTCSFAQNKIASDWKESKSDFHLAKKSIEPFEKETVFLSEQKNKDVVYTLPVVVHVITTGDAVGLPDNPSDANINEMIKNLNNAYAKKGTNYGGASMKIQFKLAIRSPQNTTTTGIDRVDGSGVTNYISGGITNDHATGSADEIVVKNLSRWSNTDYINIWIVNKIDGNALRPGGYAYFPEHTSSLIDGIVLQASVVDATNKTIVHEMGHFFSLYHTFYDGAFETTCAVNNDCTQDGDKVCDTEPMLNVDCNTSTNNCNDNQPFAIADAEKNYTVLNNFMSYSSCQWMFTEGQKTRARSALLNFRGGLITSEALTPADGIFPIAACIPTAANNLSQYYGVEKVDFNTLHVYSATSLGESSFYIDRTVNQSTTLIAGNSYTLIITGCYGNPHRIKAFIDYNNDGDFDDANETLLSSYTDTAKKKITVPTSGIMTGTALRMRIVADNPVKPAPTACKLHGDAGGGVGQIEDYKVIITAPAIASTAQKKSIEIISAEQ